MAQQARPGHRRCRRDSTPFRGTSAVPSETVLEEQEGCHYCQVLQHTLVAHTARREAERGIIAGACSTA
jgi:hypothetical protein